MTSFPFDEHFAEIDKLHADCDALIHGPMKHGLIVQVAGRRPRRILAGETPWPWALRRCLRCWQVLMGGEPHDEKCGTCQHATFTDATGAA